MQRSIAAIGWLVNEWKYSRRVTIWSLIFSLSVMVSADQLLAQNAVQPSTSELKVEKAESDEPAEQVTKADDPPKELITQEKSEAFRKNRRDTNPSDTKFKRAILAGQRSTITDKYLREGIRVWVFRMTLKENQKKVRARLGELMRQLRTAGRSEKKIQLQKNFRTFVCKETLDRAKELLDNNTEIRLNATILISELNVVEAGSRNNPPAQAYSPSTEVLLSILEDNDQPIAVKIVACRGITRISLLGTPLLKTAHKNKLVGSIVKELQAAKQLSREQAGPWYQARLLETLAAIDLPLTVNGDPVIFMTLESFLEDTKRDPFVRCIAARSLGRARLVQHANARSDRLALKLGKLGLDLTNGYNQKPQAYYYWQKCFWDLYVAFRPENAEDKSLYRNRKLGLLAKYPVQKDIKDAYHQIIPLTKHVLQQPVETRRGPELFPIKKPQIQLLSDWIKNHPQAVNYRAVPPEATIRTAGSR